MLFSVISIAANNSLWIMMLEKKIKKLVIESALPESINLEIKVQNYGAYVDKVFTGTILLFTDLITL